MHITGVRAVQPIAAESPPDWRTSLGQILVAVDTDAGLTGYGVGGGGLAGVHVVRTVLRDVLLGKNPEPIADLWWRMNRAILPFGRKGLAVMALSGVDLALWDLRGKAVGLPVAELLADEVLTPGLSPKGRGEPREVRREIPTYVTVLDEINEELAGSFHAFKLHIERRAKDDALAGVLSAVEQARSVIGPDCSLMLDAWMQWDRPTSLTVAEELAGRKIDWLEGPLPADDFAGYAELVARSPIPIAGGEHEFLAAGFRELIDRRLHHVLQPDVCWCGGLSELIRIYQMAAEAGLRVCPHRGAELWALHAIAALDPQPLAESGRPWMTWVGGQPPIREGFIRLPEAPGFGVEIDEDNLPLKNGSS